MTSKELLNFLSLYSNILFEKYDLVLDVTPEVIYNSYFVLYYTSILLIPTGTELLSSKGAGNQCYGWMNGILVVKSLSALPR